MLAEPYARIDALDGLRAAAVLLVVIFHFFGEAVLPSGSIGVDIFFVISGYLITTSLLNDLRSNGTIRLSGFYRRRLYRIAPSLLVMLAFVAPVIMTMIFLGYVERNYADDILFALTSSMNLARAAEYTTGGFLGHTWSLSIEEQFYLIWPMAMKLATRRFQRKQIAWMVVGLVFAIMTWRSGIFFDGGSVRRIYNSTDTRADAILIGCLLAYTGTAWARHTLRMWWLPCAALTGTALTIGWRSPMFALGGFTIIALLSAWLVALIIEKEPKLSTALRTIPAIWIGRRSYSLYLWHYPLFVLTFYIGPSFLVTAAAIGLSFLAADLSYRLVELPAIKRGRRSDVHQPIAAKAE